MCRSLINSSCTDCIEKVDYRKEGLDSPPYRVPCTICGMPKETYYIRNVKWYSICWIPIVPLWYGDAYLACKGCDSKLANLKMIPCNTCGMTVPYGFKYCSECGSGVD